MELLPSPVLVGALWMDVHSHGGAQGSNAPGSQ